MIDIFSTFTPRIICTRDTIIFRIQKRAKDKTILERYQKELGSYGIPCSIIRTKHRDTYSHILQIYGGYVFSFLKLVDNFKGGEEWKQICAKRIHTLAVMRNELK